MRAEQTGRDRAYRVGVYARLVQQFREDAAAALRTLPGDKSQPLQCQFVLPADRTVTYRVLAGQIERNEHSADKLVRQESYRLPDGRSATVTVDSDAKPPLARLVITDGDGHSLAGRTFEIIAWLGKDHRFTEVSAGGQ
jgi:hypothetical protein